MGENYLTYSHIWGPKNTLGRKYALHIRNIHAPQINHVCDNFRPHGRVLVEVGYWGIKNSKILSYS